MSHPLRRHEFFPRLLKFINRFCLGLGLIPISSNADLYYAHARTCSIQAVVCRPFDGAVAGAANSPPPTKQKGDKQVWNHEGLLCSFGFSCRGKNGKNTVNMGRFADFRLFESNL